MIINIDLGEGGGWISIYKNKFDVRINCTPVVPMILARIVANPAVLIKVPNIVEVHMHHNIKMKNRKIPSQLACRDHISLLADVTKVSN